MPLVEAPRLRRLAARLLEAAGATAQEAETVAELCVEANLVGHDSHGVIQVPTYIDRMRRGHIVPGAPFEVVRETETTTVVDGHWGFGFVVSRRAMEMTIEKARRHRVAAATVYRQSHVGRLAAYPLMAARQGLIALMTADSGRSAKAVVPFGGAEPRLGTNPICIAVPADLPEPLFIDMATSAVAAGKVNLALARGQSIPTGWVVDAQGRHTTDPAALGQGGALLPLGGSEGHKGYGLSVIVEILSGLLTGLGFGHDPSGRHNDGCFMAVFDVSAFRPLEEFKREVAQLARYLKSSTPAQGTEEVLYPGELEARRREERLRDGIPVEDATWERLQALARELGLAPEEGR